VANIISSFIGKTSFGFPTISWVKPLVVELPLTVAVYGFCGGYDTGVAGGAAL
jgi:hypothetical protein